MYRIKRHYQVAEKQPWLIDLLVKLKLRTLPLAKHRRVQACTPQPRRGHQTARVELEKRKISPFYIRDITEKDDEIIISYKGGKPVCLSK